MADPVNSLLNFTTSGQPLVHILLTLLILAGGHLTVKALKIAGRKLWVTGREDVTRKWIKEREEKIELIGNFLEAGVITVSLFYLNTGITTELFQEIQMYLPRIFTVILIGILGVTLIKITTQIVKNFLQTTGVKNYIRETGLSVNSIKLLVGTFKAFLYLLLVQVLVAQLNIGSTFISEIITASSWAIAFLVAALLFYGFRDLFQNFAAGAYLKNSRIVRPGEEVKVDGESGEIRDVSLFSTTVNTSSGYTVLAPNKKIVESNLRFKRAESDLDTLEEISSYFVAEGKDYSAAASLEMTLEVLGFRKSQEEIFEKIEDTQADEEDKEYSEIEKIQETVSNLTDHRLNSAWIEKDKISDINNELKSWFNDGAITVLRINKDLASEETEKSGYCLAVGVEGQEILIVDPSEEGVYYMHKDRLEDALDFKEGGYLVVAPEGTTSYWRVKNELVYSEKKHYEELSKTLESRLRKIIRQGRILDNSAPEAMEKYMEKWRSDETSALLWRPEQGETDEKTTENN